MAKEKKTLAQKIPSSFTILAILTLFVGFLTWVIPAGKYDTTTVSTIAGEKEIAVKDTYKSSKQRTEEAQAEYNRVLVSKKITEEEAKTSEDKDVVAAKEALEAAKAIKHPQGIWEVLKSPITGIKETVDIMVLVLFVGGMLAMEAKVGAIQAGFKHLMKKMKGNEKWLIALSITILAIGGSAYGGQEETVVYYAFMVPMMLAAGYNAMTALMTVVVGYTVGVAASTVNPFSSLIAVEVAGGTNSSVGMLGRAIMLVVGIVIGSWYVMRYAEKVKAGHYKEDSANDHKLQYAKATDGDDKFDTKRKITLTIVMMTLIVITIMGFIPWDTFGINWFVDFNAFIYQIPFIGQLIGKVTPFGWWWFDELSIIYLVAALAIGYLYKIGDREFVDIFIQGAKDVLGVVLIIGAARAITVVMNDGNITHTILHALETALAGLPEGVLKGLFGGALYLIYLPLAFLIPSTSGLASVSMPIFGQLAELTGVGLHVALAAFVAASGIMQMVAPTVGSLMGGAVACGISYTKYLKRIGELFLILSVTYIIIITIMAVTGFAI